MNLSRAIARTKINDLGIVGPEDLKDIEDICWALGAYVQFESMENAEARITMTGEKAVITARPNEKYPTRTRFSIGHELGHFLLHKNKQTEFLCDASAMRDWLSTDAQKKLEVEANEFSIEFLMPFVFVEPLIKKQKPCWQLIDELAETFNMSIMATVRRFIEVSEEPIAAIFFNKDGVNYHLGSRFFQEQNFWIQRGGLSKDTFAFDALSGNAPKRMSSVAASGWLNVKPWLEDETILEESRFFSNLGFGISILWINNGKLIR